MSILPRLWRDDSGFIGSTDYILIASIVVIGAVCGLVTLRDAVVQNLGDVAIALESLDQSYTVNFTLSNGAAFSFGYPDPAPAAALLDAPGEAPYGIELCEDGDSQEN